MTLFVDASALISIIVGEDDADDLTSRLDGDPRRLCSAMSLWETVAGLHRTHRIAIPDARRITLRFVQELGMIVVSIGIAEHESAMDAYRRFGKGRHPASLNMGDCFAYACARTNRAALLYKGNDFSQTDLASLE